MKISNKADTFFTQKKEQIAQTEVLALLDGMIPPIWQYKDDALERIERLLAPQTPPTPKPPVTPNPPKKVIKNIHRQAMFPAKTLTTEEEIDTYIEKVRANMKQLLKNCDGIKLS